MANSDYEKKTVGAFTPIAELKFPVDYLDPVLQFENANFPSTDSLKIGMAALLDDEWLQVTAIGVDNVTVKRGCADTVPAQHAGGALVWFTTGTVNSDKVEHAAGEENGVKFSPYTTSAVFPIEQGSPDAITYNYRFYRPYPPGQLRVNGERWYVPFSLTAAQQQAALTWAHRDRLLEADQLVDHDVANIGPEPGTTYTARIYDSDDVLKRTEVGIMAATLDAYGNLIAPNWTYTWLQALSDLGVTQQLEFNEIVPARMTFCSTRDGFDSWQAYDLVFDVSTQGHYLRVAQFTQLNAQGDVPDDPDTPPLTGMYSAQFAQLSAQEPGEDVPDVHAHTGASLFVANMSAEAGQSTALKVDMNRNLFEAPYVALLHRGVNPLTNHLMTVAARPVDRLTDAHSVYSRYDYPQGSGAAQPFGLRDTPNFTPWVTTNADVDYLQTTVPYTKSSFYDGIPLSDVAPGQLAMIDVEIVCVVSVADGVITVRRGCADTIPTYHYANSRLWFFEAEGGYDPTPWPLSGSSASRIGAVEVKTLPDTHTPVPLTLNDVSADRLELAYRTDRPYPPGRVTVDGQPWYFGGRATLDHAIRFDWVHRNRITQAGTVVDHTEDGVALESGVTYIFKIVVSVRGTAPGSPLRTYTIREVDLGAVTGWEYPYEYALADGNRVGNLIKACGHVSVGARLIARRGDIDAWQNYVIMLLLPSYTCPPGRTPGVSPSDKIVVPPIATDGAGDNGDVTGHDNQGDGDTLDNGDGSNGDGPPPPPPPPPDWPDDLDTYTPPPDDPNPALGAHWDSNWDRHWDAYTNDNEGG